MKPRRKQLMKFRSTEEAFIAIFSAVAYLDWGVASPDNDDDNAVVEGLVIGTEEYINRVLADDAEDAPND